MRIARGFLRSWLAVGAALCACALAFTLLVDPYRMLDLASIGGVNASKPKAVNQVSIAKAYGAARARADVVLVGNSRVDVGFAAEDAIWQSVGTRAYNLGLPGAGIVEQGRHLHHANAAQRARVVFIGVDFIDFLFDPAQRMPPVVAEDRLDLRLLVDRAGRANSARWRGLVADSVTAFFSLDALWDAVRTATDQGPFAADITPLGSNPMRDYDELILREGHRALFEQRNLESLRLRLGPRREIRRADGTRAPAFALVADMVRPLQDGRTRFVLFTHPYHAQILEIYRLAGIWERFEQWKADLVAFAAELNGSGGNIELWDFADYDDYTTEAVPPLGDRATRMRWYWEGGHYKRAFGAMMARRMLEPSLDGPGARLQAATLAARLAAIRARGEAYRRDFAADIERLARQRDALIRRGG